MGAQQLLLTHIPSPGSGLGCWRSLRSAVEGWRAWWGVGAAAQRWAASALPAQQALPSSTPGTNALTKALGCEEDCL